MEDKENIAWEESLKVGKVPCASDMQCSIESEREEGEIPDNESGMKEPDMTKEEVVDAIKNLDRRMAMIELSLAAANGFQSAWTKARIITSAEMESMVKQAVSVGPSYGVGRGFIKTHLNRELGVPDSPHYVKRVNQAIRNLVAKNEMALDEQFQLYKKV